MHDLLKCRAAVNRNEGFRNGDDSVRVQRNKRIGLLRVRLSVRCLRIVDQQIRVTVTQSADCRRIHFQRRVVAVRLR